MSNSSLLINQGTNSSINFDLAGGTNTQVVAIGYGTVSTVGTLPNTPGGTINLATVAGNLGTIGTIGLATIAGNVGVSSGTINVSTISTLPNTPGGTINLATVAGNLGTLGTIGLATVTGNLGTIGTIGLATVAGNVGVSSGTINVSTISSLPNLPQGSINVTAGTVSAGTVFEKFASAASLTITLASLATSGSVGRISNYVDNTTTRYQSALVYVQVTIGSAAPTANSPVNVYLARSDNSAINDDGNGTADASGTFVNTPLLGVINIPSNGTNQQVYGVFDTAPLGALGPAWGIGLLNNSGGSLHPTAGSQKINWVGRTQTFN